MDFSNFNLDPGIMAGIKSLHYTTPTPIQEQAIPVVLEGRDLIGLAQTGTGKTAAFVLPILQKLMNIPRHKIGALIISPTRELAEQTTEAINVFSYYTKLRGVSVYGGVSMYNQVAALERGAEIVVACPGRLMDHLLKGSVELTHLEILVIDEADRMFDMGFLPDIRNIVRCITQPHQTLLFSATMPPDIRKLVQEVLHDPVTVQIGQSAPVDSVSHALYPVKQHLKLPLLKAILKNTDTDSVVVFMRTKHRVERVADALRRDGFSVAALQGDMEQRQRQFAIEGFKNGDLKILVATDIAARGLDILSISHVINYDMPDTTDAYIHRIGRTGRVNNKGDAFTLVTTEDREMVKALEKIFKKPIETRQIEGFNYDAADLMGDNRRSESGSRSGSGRPGRQSPRWRQPTAASGDQKPSSVEKPTGSYVRRVRSGVGRTPVSGNNAEAGSQTQNASRPHTAPRHRIENKSLAARPHRPSPSSRDVSPVRFAKPEDVTHFK